jgi:UDP-N-acetylglucosamine 4,6-dehydratase
MEGGEVFVPKIPSMPGLDLAEAIAPGTPHQVIGIRPGEKLHELLLTDDEARHTLDCGDLYVVLPEDPWWNDQGSKLFGSPVPGEFVYASNTNDEWLTVEQLRDLLGTVAPAAVA